MVKADLARDYYGDLEIAPTADLAEIKKQFKKLALAYHPDRNPGREAQVTAKFQLIQSAHEVLTDTTERAKYDANRVRSSARYQTGGNAKGNPWSHVSSQYPPPPKAPTARQRPPPPSAGAQRYKNFEVPRPSASAQEGAEARRSTYEAWENMRNSGAKTGPGQTWNKPGPVPKGTPQSGREESNNFKHRPPPKAGPGYTEFRDSYSPAGSPRMRAQSSSRKGFMPNTPGGDEPAAPKGAYFTERNKAPQAPWPEPAVSQDRPSPRQKPVPPPRGPHYPYFDPQSTASDPLQQFRQKANVPNEPRLSTPYATHGGEKLDPFETANLNRSKSTRERRDPHDRSSDTPPIPRAASDASLKSPKGSSSFGQSSRRAKQSFAVPDSDSSSDSGPRKGQRYEDRTYAKPRSSVKSPQTNEAFTPSSQQGFASGSSSEQTNRRASNGFNFSPTPQPQANAPPQASQPPDNENPSMYGTHFKHVPQIRKRFPTVSSAFDVRLPTVSESPEYKDLFSDPFVRPLSRNQFNSKYPNLFPEPNPHLAAPPSGVSGHTLFPLEETQRSVLDNLINSKNNLGASFTRARESSAPSASKYYQFQPREQTSPASSEGSPPQAMSRKQRHRSSEVYSSFGIDASRTVWLEPELKAKLTNRSSMSRFNFKVDENTFKRTTSNSFSSSAENINTKFTPEEWEGKFEAGYFQPEQKTGNVPATSRARAQSGSRTRGRSPVKNRPLDPHYPNHSDSEIPMAQSPGGTKFSQEEWANTFKPQTFMPPPAAPASKGPPRPTRKRSNVVKPTMGTAGVVVDPDSDSSLEKPLFTGRNNAASSATTSTPTPAAAPPSPDPMDVDTPPTFTPAPRIVIPELPKPTPTPKSPSKRPASPTDQAELKVNFDDLSITSLLGKLSLPIPPIAPSPPTVPTTQAQYHDYLARFNAYMAEWDLFRARIVLHLVARKNRDDEKGEERWMGEGEGGLDGYRKGVGEDVGVVGVLGRAMGGHGEVLRGFKVVRERMKMAEGEGVEEVGGEERPRKKVY